MKVVHSWLKDYLGEALPSVEKIEELLTFHAFEIEAVEQVADETVIDVKVLPDRASDALSHRGIARELASIVNLPLAHDPLQAKPQLPTTDAVTITIEDSVACRRFSAVVMTDIVVKESPEWLQKRLAALGQRSINNIVDATNYVMFALGQPMHAYDADKFPKVHDTWQIVVRTAKSGEVVQLLAEGGKTEERTVELNGTELLIVDGSTDTPVGLAGIKGGRFAELTLDTKNIILEAASFDSVVIRKTARRLGILTDASKRFENSPASLLPTYAQEMIVTLIKDIAGGAVVGMADEYPSPIVPVSVEVSVERVNRLLGLSLSTAVVRAVLIRIGADVQETAAGVFTVIAPWERTDLLIEADYIAEVGRLCGLDQITSVVPEVVPLREVNARQYYTEQLRHALMAVGFSEVITSSFAHKADIQLQNALASDKSYVRKTLLKNIESVLDANVVHTDLLGLVDVRVFEIGTVFKKTEAGIGEYVALTLGARTKGNGYNQKDDVVVQQGIQAVETVLGANLTWNIEKGMAELNLTERLAAMPVPTVYDEYRKTVPVTYVRPSIYPAMSRDIALWVAGGEEVSVVTNTLITAAGPLLVRHTLFDTFTKDGRTSYAFRFVFQSMERTLTDEEVVKIMDAVYVIAKERGWEVR